MAGTIRPNEIAVSFSPDLASKSLPNLLDVAKPDKKHNAPRSPRVDLEPLYAGVKGAIADAEWNAYKTALSSFLLGNLNQEELSQRLDRILTTPALEHAHNSLVMGVYANIWRDAPEPGVASWVSSSDKPSSGVSKGTGDESERRMKHEVMQLNRRERKRLKTIHQGGGSLADISGWDGAGSVMQEYHEARRAKLPEVGLATASGQYSKTNWDLEIRKRYTSSLFVETHEFPTATTISHRLLPICYEFGLPQGHHTECAEFMNIATETYIKEALMNFFKTSSSNGQSYIRTADYKRRVDREERKVQRGELQRVNGGELPVEAEERRKRPLMCMEDLKIALMLGDSYLGQVPLIAGSITNSRFLDSLGMDELNDEKPKPGKALTNGLTNGVNHNDPQNGTHANGWTFDLGDPMVLDEDLAWQGGSVKDIDDLDNALDAVLELGDL